MGAGGLAEAEAQRVAARQALDSARAALTRARADLEKAQAAVDAPLQAADRPLGERFAALIYTWPLRVALRDRDGYSLDPIDLALCGSCARQPPTP